MVKTSNTTGILGTEQIISEALDMFTKANPEKAKPSYIKEHLSEVCIAIFDKAHEIYRKYEKKVLETLGEDILKREQKQSFSKDDVKKMMIELAPRAAAFEMRLRQSRAARAGRTFEIIVSKLLDEIGIPNEHVTKEDKASGLQRIDIVVPDKKTAIRDPFNAKYLSLKTSLKDRWKLVPPDQRQGQRTFLVTLLQKEKLTKEVAEKIKNTGIRLYVPDEIKKDFANNDNVRKLSDLPKDLR